MFRTSTALKNNAAAYKRTASSLRSAAEQSALNIADKGVLLTAAAIMDGMGARIGRDAKEAKAKEEKYERDIKAAMAKIRPAINALPTETTLQKVAIACSLGSFSSHLVGALRKEKDAAGVLWQLNYWADQAKNDGSSHYAYCVATGKTTPDAAISEAQAKFHQEMMKPVTIGLAQRFENAMDQKAEAA